MVYEGGKAAGYDLSKHVAHLPGIEMNVPETMEKMISGDWKGVKEELGAARLKLPPVPQIAKTASEKGFVPAVKEWARWPGAPTKWFAEAPKNYGGSTPEWIMGVPTAEAHEKKLRNLRKQARKEKAQHKKPTPTEELFKEITGERPSDSFESLKSLLLGD